MKRVVGIGFILFVLLSGIFVYQYSRFGDSKLHVVICDVGQGDAIFLRTPGGSDIVVDGGPNDSVLSCLAGRMPFWDRDLELVILTHPHADHLDGLISVSKRYKILSFATENLKNNTVRFKALIDELKNQNIKMQYLYSGDRFVFKDGVSLDIVGPSKEFIRKTSPQGKISDRNEFANIESLIKYKDFSVLLTGDSQAGQLNDAILSGRVGDIDVLQVPHHGSKTGLTLKILDTLNPKLAIISVGKNKYGHPTREMLEILKLKDIKVLRTDLDGEIEIISDGSDWIAK